MICPSLEDFVSYNGLRPLGNMICPSSEDFAAYNGIRLLGNMICPSSEDFVTYNGLRPARPIEKTMSIQKREMISGERRNTLSLDLCVPILSMIFGKINGAKANSLGRIVGCLTSLYVGISSY